MGIFALECGYRPDDVYGMGWVALVRLTLFMDDVMAERKRAADRAKASSSSDGNWGRMY